MARPNLSRYRLMFMLIPAVVVGFGLFLAAALLVRQRVPPAVPPVPQAVVLLQRVPPHPAASGGKSGSRKAATGMVKAGVRGPLLRVPPPLLSPGLTLPTPGLSGAKTQTPMRFADPDELNNLAAVATASFLGLKGRGHGHQQWVGGGGGLFYLPDSGIRVRQLRYTCSRVPMNDRSKTMTALVSALVTPAGRVTDVSVTSAAIEGAPADSIRKAMEDGWRFQPLVINGKATAFRLRFVTVVETNMETVIAVHCWWGRFNAAHRGSLTPTWIVYVPKEGLPIAYAYIAPQHLGEAPGGLAAAAGEQEDKP